MRKLIRHLDYWLRHRAIERDLADELEMHRAMKQEELERSGLTAGEARAASHRELGNLTLAREDSRGIWTPPSIDSIRQDVRYAVRALRRQPGFTALAVAVLAAGIGLNTSLFTLFNALALRQWPVHAPDRVVTLYNMSPSDIRVRGGGAPRGFSLEEISYFEGHSTTTGGFIATRTGGGDRTLGEDDTPVAWVSGNYFNALGVEMALGRGFQPHEDASDSPTPVAVLSYGYWQRRFAGHPGIVGQEVRFEDLPFTIVGITARTFTGTDPARVDVWMPLSTVPLLRPDDRWVQNVLRQPRNCCLGVAARLAPGVTRAQAQSELTLLDRQFRGAAATPQDGVVVRGTEFVDDPKDQVTGVFVPLFGGVLLVLVLACANVANLLIARGALRGREIATRLALGASRARVVRQLLTEAAILVLLGGGIGMLIATWLPATLLNVLVPNWSLQIAPDAGVLLFALTIAGLSVFLSGLAPALHATRATVSSVISQGTHPGGRFWLRNGLLGLQVCAATVLLVAAGLLVRAVHDATTRSLGYSLQGLSVVTFEAPARGFAAAQTRSAAAHLATELSALEASGTLALTSTAPLGSGNIKGSFRLPGGTQDENNAVYEVSPGYFELLGIPIVAGRTFKDTDIPGTAIVVNESLARQFWTVESAVGRRLVVDPAEGGWNSAGTPEIIGVARNASMAGIGDTGPVIYQPLTGRALPEVLVRTTSRIALDAVMAAVARADARVRTRTRLLTDNLAPRVRGSRIGALLAGSLGGLALVVASIGMFGVFAYWVQLRTREIGVRMALGARGPQIVSLVLRASLWAVSLGGLAGAAAAMASSRLLSSYLFGLSPLDPRVYVAVIALVGASAALATYLPARRATRIDPVTALRCE